MSIAVLISVHDGLVIAADSAASLTVSTTPGTFAGIAKVYDNANKIFNLYKGRPIGAVIFGSGSIGNSSIGTLMKDLRASLESAEKAKEIGIDFNPNNYTMEGVSKIVAKFLGDECQKQNPAISSTMNIGLLLGGYSTASSLGEGWGVEIKAGKPTTPKLLRPPDQVGISWGGVSEAIQRLVVGFSPRLFQALTEIQKDKTPLAQFIKEINPYLVAKLQAPFVFAPMPIQDAIDLARFLVHSTIMYSRFSPGPQIVGGQIEIAAITKHEQFKWISRKHYYDQSLNQEPKHVVID